MRRGPFFPWFFAALCALGSVGQATGEGDSNQPIRLVVPAGRPLHVRLDSQMTVTRVGQSITATVIEPVYTCDRVVIPAGSTVFGHVARLVGPSRVVRAEAMLSGNFSPMREVVLQFESLVLADGTRIPIRTAVQPGTENVTLQVAAPSRRARAIGRARQEVAQRTSDAVAALKAPGKLARLKDMLVNRLPYHPQYLRRGTVYDADLLAPLDFGTATATARETAGVLPAPDSVLNVRLVTALDSAKSTRGTEIQAIVTRPVFSSSHRLILPEGTVLGGEVTYSRPARRFHRNGQLRFLFERVDLPDQGVETMLASLHAAEVSADAHVAIDEEGGASVASSNTRFIAPALAFVAARAAGGDHDRYDRDRIGGSAVGGPEGANIGGRALGGFSGFGLLGVALGRISRPVAAALGFYGLAGTVYVSVIGKGSEVRFPAGVRMQLQLAPGPSSRQ